MNLKNDWLIIFLFYHNTYFYGCNKSFAKVWVCFALKYHLSHFFRQSSLWVIQKKVRNKWCLVFNHYTTYFALRLCVLGNRLLNYLYTATTPDALATPVFSACLISFVLGSKITTSSPIPVRYRLSDPLIVPI